MANPRSWLPFGQSFSSPSSPTTPSSISGRALGDPASAAGTGTGIGSGPSSPRTPGLSVFKSLSSPISSSSSGPGGVLGGVEKDTDELFCSHTVQEIKQIEQQTRLDIDRRKEDLRQMVGERYRDLIDAADSIVDMKKCSELMVGSVSSMEQVCHRLQQTYFLKGSGGMRGPPQKNKSHEVAAQLKLLADAPEKIWQCLEDQSYLLAAQYFLLSRHIFSHLELSGAGSDVVKKLWHSVSSFKDTIMECCSCHLQCSELEEGPMVQSLCAMMLLEGCSPRQAFAKFLVARKAAIQSVFRAAVLGEGPHRSVKSQVCQVTRSVLHSLLHISAIFCQQRMPDGSLGSSLLLQKLTQFTSQEKRAELNQDLIAQGLTHRLPRSVVEFTPSLHSTVLTEIPPSDIHSSTEDWVNMCQSDISNSVNNLLQHVNSVKALAAIRAAVHSLLANPTEEKEKEKDKESNFSSSSRDGESNTTTGFADVGNSWSEQWAEICNSVLGHGLCLWDAFLRPLLLQRAKVIIEKSSTAVSQHATSQLSELLVKVASDPALFHADTNCHTHLWKEEGLGLGLGGTGGGRRKGNIIAGGGRGGGRSEGFSLADAGGINTLSLKAKACTPSVYSFCQGLGLKLDSLIEDVSHYLQRVEPSSLLSLSRSKDVFPFPLHGDTAALQDYLQETAAQCVSRFLQAVDQKVAQLKELINSKRQGQPHEVIDRLLLVGRICCSLLDCCPSLAQLAVGCRGDESENHSGFGRFSLKARSRLHSRKEVDSKRAIIANMLQQRSLTVFRIWAKWCSDVFSQQFHSQLSAEMELNALTSTLAWEEITISEESESGTQVSSVIRVPSQTSIYVTSLLFTVCQEISRIGGQALDQSILAELSSLMMQAVVQHYEDLLQKSCDDRGDDVTGIPQQCSLQLQFNLNFLTSVLLVQEEKLAARVKGLLEQLQSFVDPFDLDVFTPYIQSNLHRQLHRSNVLLGMLLAVKNSLSPSKPPPPSLASGSQHQEKHIVLPLTPAINRLPALPLSSKQTQSSTTKYQLVLSSPMEPRTSFSLHQTVTFFHHL